MTTGDAWEHVALGDLVQIRKGVSYKGAFLDQPGLPLMGLGVFRAGGGYLPGKERSYGGPYKAHHRLEPGQLFLALTDITQEGHVLGSPARVPDDLGPCLITHHVASVVPKPEAPIDLLFLYYVLCSDASRSHFRGMATGTTVRAVSPTDAGRVTVRLPPLNVQKRIARALGTLDDRIALLERMAKTLEDLVLTVFQAWFLRFENDGPLDEGELGPQPPGWPIVPIDDLIEFDPKTPLKKGTHAPFVDMKALPTSGSTVDAFLWRAYSGGSRFQNDDTLFARITPCLENGKTALVDFLEPGLTGAGSTEFIVMRPRTGVPPAFPYCWARNPRFRAHAIANMTGSSGRQRVSADALRSFSVVKPPPERLARFSAVTTPIFSLISSYARQKKALAELRDTLLPSLISGERHIPEA